MNNITSKNYLIKKWKYLENEYLANKLDTMAPKINSNCPESFSIYNREKSRKRRQYDTDSNINNISIQFRKKEKQPSPISKIIRYLYKTIK
jgi:hypothetical protein